MIEHLDGNNFKVEITFQQSWSFAYPVLLANILSTSDFSLGVVEVATLLFHLSKEIYYLNRLSL